MLNNDEISLKNQCVDVRITLVEVVQLDFRRYFSLIMSCFFKWTVKQAVAGRRAADRALGQPDKYTERWPDGRMDGLVGWLVGGRTDGQIGGWVGTINIHATIISTYEPTIDRWISRWIDFSYILAEAVVVADYAVVMLFWCPSKYAIAP